ncbi:MAG: hypothetical protein IBX63_11175 [Coriobacteriia bacterium]|nr:hypothetical protein [Coriobacteriia bacterium]
MAWGRIKSEHTGAKRGKGYWGRKAMAKQASRRARRREDPMGTKLTLRLDEDLIRRAKRHSARSGKSVSRLVADYFALIADAIGIVFAFTIM